MLALFIKIWSGSKVWFVIAKRYARWEWTSIFISFFVLKLPIAIAGLNGGFASKRYRIYLWYCCSRLSLIMFRDSSSKQSLLFRVSKKGLWHPVIAEASLLQVPFSIPGLRAAPSESWSSSEASPGPRSFQHSWNFEAGWRRRRLRRRPTSRRPEPRHERRGRWIIFKDPHRTHSVDLYLIQIHAYCSFAGWGHALIMQVD